jgi:hypothetical protein
MNGKNAPKLAPGEWVTWKQPRWTSDPLAGQFMFVRYDESDECYVFMQSSMEVPKRVHRDVVGAAFMQGYLVRTPEHVRAWEAAL